MCFSIVYIFIKKIRYESSCIVIRNTPHPHTLEIDFANLVFCLLSYIQDIQRINPNLSLYIFYILLYHPSTVLQVIFFLFFCIPFLNLPVVLPSEQEHMLIHHDIQMVLRIFLSFLLPSALIFCVLTVFIVRFCIIIFVFHFFYSFSYLLHLVCEKKCNKMLLYHISSSHLHKKRTFPCASLLIFSFFPSPLHIFRGYPFSVTSCASSVSEDSSSGLVQFQEPQVCQIR